MKTSVKVDSRLKILLLKIKDKEFILENSYLLDANFFLGDAVFSNCSDNEQQTAELKYFGKNWYVKKR